MSRLLAIMALLLGTVFGWHFQHEIDSLKEAQIGINARLLRVSQASEDAAAAAKRVEVMLGVAQPRYPDSLPLLHPLELDGGGLP
jgi:hypothetical protein